MATKDDPLDFLDQLGRAFSNKYNQVFLGDKGWGVKGVFGGVSHARYYKI